MSYQFIFRRSVLWIVAVVICSDNVVSSFAGTTNRVEQEEIRNVLKDVNRLRSQCKDGQYLDLGMLTCKSCDKFCPTAICGPECQDYYMRKNLTAQMAQQRQIMKEKSEELKGMNKAQEEQIGALEIEIIVLTTAVPIIVFLGIGAFIYLQCKFKKRPHRQTEQDPCHKQLLAPKGDETTDQNVGNNVAQDAPEV